MLVWMDLFTSLSATLAKSFLFLFLIIEPFLFTTLVQVCYVLLRIFSSSFITSHNFFCAAISANYSSLKIKLVIIIDEIFNCNTFLVVQICNICISQVFPFFLYSLLFSSNNCSTSAANQPLCMFFVNAFFYSAEFL